MEDFASLYNILTKMIESALSPIDAEIEAKRRDVSFLR